MRYTCDQLFRRKYIQLMKLFIPLCIDSPDKYSFSMFIIVKLFYHIYIEYEIYKLAYNTKNIYDGLIIDVIMGKWDGVVTFS